MIDFEPVIGLEIHVQLKTKTKIFCSCLNEFTLEPNKNICPVCLGLPGVLPVLNKKAFRLALKAALALNCKINKNIVFDRKNYFYPDLPKNYQISEYFSPLGENGYLEIILKEDQIKKIRIKRIHLEEDAGKLIHTEKFSLIDYNRAGAPLIEIVTEPDIFSPDEAFKFLQQLKLLLQYLEVSDCDMEKGFLRCDANISVRKKGEAKLGVKTEIKNMNSFKAVKSALEYEFKRQVELLKENKEIIQETRLWDEAKQKTFSMRKKEEAHDYRYFPEPDLPVFTPQDEEIESIKSEIKELPLQKLLRFKSTFNLTLGEAEFLIQDREMAEFFEETAKNTSFVKDLYNLLKGPISEYLNQNKISFKQVKISSSNILKIIELKNKGKLNNIQVKEVLFGVLKENKSPEEIMREKGIEQISDESKLLQIVEDVMKRNLQACIDYKKGKKSAIMFLVGQVMKETRGKANPNLVREILERRLKNED